MILGWRESFVWNPATPTLQTFSKRYNTICTIHGIYTIATDFLWQIQCVLQDVGSHIATPRNVATEKKLCKFSSSRLEASVATIPAADCDMFGIGSSHCIQWRSCQEARTMDRWNGWWSSTSDCIYTSSKTRANSFHCIYSNQCPSKSGGRSSSALHVARTICRRTERRL